jgi:hypothetical protein
MHAMWIRALTLSLVLGGPGLLLGQQAATPAQSPDTGKADDKIREQAPAQPANPAAKDKEPQPTKLEDMIKQALQNNADIRVAETKVAEADAELNRTRQVVMQKVVLYKANVDYAKAKLGIATKRLQQTQALVNRGGVSQEEVQVAEAAVLSAKADLAKVEADLPLLLGKQTTALFTEKAVQYWGRTTLDSPRYELAAFDDFKHASSTVRLWALDGGSLLTSNLQQQLPAAMFDRIKKALDKETEQAFTGNPTDVLTALLKQVEGVPSKIQLDNQQICEGSNGLETTPDPTNPSQLKVGIHIDFHQKVPLGAMIQAFQDSASPKLRIVVRDYGILVTDEAHRPPGSLLLHDVWKGNYVDLNPSKKAPGEKVSEPSGPGK